MEAVAAGLDEETRRRLAAHYGSLSRAALTSDVGAELLERGERIARRGVPARKVGACVHCHGPGEGPRNPIYPSLAGQYPEYLTLQLRLFVEGNRGGTPWADVMEVSAHRLKEDEITAVAAWYAARTP